MMDMNVILGTASVGIREVEPAYGATGSVMRDAFLPGEWISLGSIDLHYNTCAFDKIGFLA